MIQIQSTGRPRVLFMFRRKLLCYGPASSRTLPVNRRSTPQHTMAYRLRHSAITFTSHPVLSRLAMLGSSSCGDTNYPQPS
ncbi:uncharacterized protein BO96DRAFT_3926 [Aspergillus niger CBS 101883]|uniref:uncharacterized protein n=1 Tax=Aspergillus lacticoffeatus (strain CBS 101883) TaxID=1450533 RepID=UPI000D7FACBF|nr:uncharacterized protein BO96DRAFT_3926 [Aspergillus niger CBS 101883]PYH61880.1 hypothetical protein BO96DRAFT_3926 [Aspergillus niger CBS 101883]